MRRSFASRPGARSGGTCACVSFGGSRAPSKTDGTTRWLFTGRTKPLPGEGSEGHPTCSAVDSASVRPSRLWTEVSESTIPHYFSVVLSTPPPSSFLRFCAPLHTPKKNIYVCSSHGLFNSNAVAILEESPVDTVFVTNSVPLPEGCKSKKIEQVSRGCWQSR